MLQGPDVPESKLVNDLVSTLDPGAALCDYAGISAFANSQSQSLCELIETDGSSRDRAYSEWHVVRLAAR